MPRQMSQRAAWLWLAKKWDKAKVYDEAGTAPHVLIGNEYEYCLCNCLRLMYKNKLVSYDCSNDMEDKVHSQPSLSDNLFGFKWPLTMRGAKSRAAFCRRMAKQCEKEAAKAKKAKVK